MRKLVIYALAGALCSFPAFAGGNNNTNNTAVGVGLGVATGGAGGAASASASSGSGDTTVVTWPNANTGSATPRWECSKVKQRNVLGIISTTDTPENKNCAAERKIRYCDRYAARLTNAEAANCLAIRKAWLAGKFNDDYEAPVVISDKKKFCSENPHAYECG